MKKFLIIGLLLVFGCRNAAVDRENNIVVANEFIDIFYSYNAGKLDSALAYARESRPAILYYQGWAEGGNYSVIKRPPCLAANDSMVVCPVTVEDDLLLALESTFQVTDTFYITVRGDKILSVDTGSNDPAIYYEAREWVRENRPELIEEACKGMWADGTTPGDCVRAMVKGYAAFIAARKSN